MLSAERTALNLLGRLSGVATLTRAYVRAVEGTGARITDTRKDHPGPAGPGEICGALRRAVNHRFGLDDAILIKDNHVAACGGGGRGPEAGPRGRRPPHLHRGRGGQSGPARRGPAVRASRSSCWTISASTTCARAVAIMGGRVTLEASGGVSLETVRAIAQTGVDVISVGALTHSAPVLDIGLDAI